MSLPSLSSGALQKMLSGDKPSSPVLQVVELIEGGNRMQVVLFDGQQQQKGVVAKQVADVVAANGIKAFSLISLDNYLVNTVNDKKNLLVLGWKSVGQADRLLGAAPASPASVPATSQLPPTPAASSPASFASSSPAASPAVVKTEPKLEAKINVSKANLSPIASLQPFSSGRNWTIRARITAKSGMRTWKGKNGTDGKLFSVDLLDESGTIRGAFFNEAADRCFGLLEVDKVYFIHKGMVKPANKQYNPKAMYEINFERDSQFELDESCSIAVPKMRYNFVHIKDLETTEANSIIDVVAIVKSIKDDTSVTTKAGNSVSKRDITLIDDSEKTVSLTLWEDNLVRLPRDLCATFPVIALKGVRVSDFGGKSLSTLGSTHMDVNPDCPEAVHLRSWFDGAGQNVEGASVGGPGGAGGDRNTVRRVFGDIESLGLGYKEKPDYFKVRGTVMFLKSENFFYAACPTDKCAKKVVQTATDSWRCEKCQKEFDQPDYRYILQLNACDYSGSSWLSAFNEVGKTLLGKSANDLQKLIAQEKAGELDTAFRQATLRDYLFTVRAKCETYQDTQRVKCSLMDATPLDFAAESRNLLADIVASY